MKPVTSKKEVKYDLYEPLDWETLDRPPTPCPIPLQSKAVEFDDTNGKRRAIGVAMKKATRYISKPFKQPSKGYQCCSQHTDNGMFITNRIYHKSSTDFPSHEHFRGHVSG